MEKERERSKEDLTLDKNQIVENLRNEVDTLHREIADHKFKSSEKVAEIEAKNKKKIAHVK